MLSAGFGLVQLGVAALVILAGPLAPAIGWVGLHSLVFLGVYAFAVRTIFDFEHTRVTELAEELTGEITYRDVSLRRVTVKYALAAAVLVGAAVFLPGAGAAVARETAHALTATAAMTMTAIAIIGLTYRAQRKRYRLSWDALAMIAVYVTTLMLLWYRA